MHSQGDPCLRGWGDDYNREAVAGTADQACTRLGAVETVNFCLFRMATDTGGNSAEEAGNGRDRGGSSSLRRTTSRSSSLNLASQRSDNAAETPSPTATHSSNTSPLFSQSDSKDVIESQPAVNHPPLLKRSRSMGVFDAIVAPAVSPGQQAVEYITGKVQLPRDIFPPKPQTDVGQAETQHGDRKTLERHITPGVGSDPKYQATPQQESPGKQSVVHSKERQSGTPQPMHDVVESPRGFDDSNLRHQALTRVDYFSHNWNESDIADSWRYIVSRRQDMANSARLENASWRMWAKAKNNLGTVSPEEVNWLKDYDVTWLYGPLYHEPSPRSQISTDSSGTASPMSLSDISSRSGPKSRSYREPVPKQLKSILKKKTIAQLMLEEAPELALGNQNPGPTANYLRHHNYRHAPIGQTRQHVADLVNRQYKSYRSTPTAEQNVSPNQEHGMLGTSELLPTSSTSSQKSVRSMHSAKSVGSRVSIGSYGDRHVHFNDRVEQCIALDPEPTGANADESASQPVSVSVSNFDSDSDSDSDSESDSDSGGGLFLGIRRPSSLDVTDCPIIAPLPATTLNYEGADANTDPEHDNLVPGDVLEGGESDSYQQMSTGGRRPGFNANYDHHAELGNPPAVHYEIVDPNIKPVDLVATGTLDPSNPSSPILSPADEELSSAPGFFALGTPVVATKSSSKESSVNTFTSDSSPLPSGISPDSQPSQKRRVRPTASFG